MQAACPAQLAAKSARNVCAASRSISLKYRMQALLTSLNAAQLQVVPQEPKARWGRYKHFAFEGFSQHPCGGHNADFQGSSEDCEIGSMTVNGGICGGTYTKKRHGRSLKDCAVEQGWCIPPPAPLTTPQASAGVCRRGPSPSLC